MGRTSFIDAVAFGYRRGTPIAAAQSILHATCRDHGITLEEMQGYSRIPKYIKARREAIAAMHKRGFSLHQIGEAMRRDHTTIVHHLQFMDLTGRVDKS